MGVGLGWREMAPQFPYIDGQAFKDSLTRDNDNKLDFSFNLCMHVRTRNGWWDYGWFVNMECGSVVSNDRKVKDQVWYDQIIAGVDYYQSVFNGNFTGSTYVGGKDTYIPLKATFHDTAGNWGVQQVWNVEIPRASSMGSVRSSVSNVGTNGATISASVNSTGAYAKITRWEITCGGVTRSGTGNTLNFSATFDNLRADTNYRYRVKVWNSAGFEESAEGSFKTDVDIIGYIVVDGKPVRVLTGYVITKEGGAKRINRIRKVESE